MAGDSKTLGIVGGILAAIGAAVAHGADDCARVGARAGAHAGDDLARPAVVGRGLTGSGDLGRAGALPALGDDAVRARPSEEAIRSLAEEASLQTLDLMLDEPSVDQEPLIAPRTLEPVVVALAPQGSERFNQTFGRAPTAVELAELGRSTLERVDTGPALVELVAKSGPLVLVIGHARSDVPERLLTHDGTVDIVEIQQTSARAGRSAVILVCESDDFDAACASSTRSNVEAALARAPKSETALVRALLAARAKGAARGPTLHRVVASEKRLRRVHSREP